MANQSANYLHLQLHHISHHHRNTSATCPINQHATILIATQYGTSVTSTTMQHLWSIAFGIILLSTSTVVTEDIYGMHCNNSLLFSWINCICGWQKLAHSEPSYLNSQCTYLSRYKPNCQCTLSYVWRHFVLSLYRHHMWEAATAWTNRLKELKDSIKHPI
jgi:hypothetical protein